MWFTYLVECKKNGSLYCGCTNDLDRRIAQHNDGTGAKYTRAFGPVKLVYFESQPDRSAACKREYAIKQLYRDQKNELILSELNELKRSPCSRSDA